MCFSGKRMNFYHRKFEINIFERREKKNVVYQTIYLFYSLLPKKNAQVTPAL